MSHLRDPRFLNLVFSAAVLAVGLAIFWVWDPPVFAANPYVLTTFEFWLVGWMLWVVGYGLTQGDSANVRSLMAAIDLGTVLRLGGCIALASGSKFAASSTLVNLILIFGLLVSWNFLFEVWVRNKSESSVLHTLWFLPSMTIGLFSLAGWAIFSVHRYGRRAEPFAVVAVLYALIQQPSYKIFFVQKSHREIDNIWIISLAFGKLLLGATFYSFILETPGPDHQLWIPKLSGLFGNQTMQKILVAIVGALTTLVANRILEWLKGRFGRQTPPQKDTASVAP